MRKVIVATLLITSCAVQHRQPSPAPPIAQVAPVQEPAPVAVVPPSDAAPLVPTDSPDIQAAMDTYLKTGKAPLIDRSKQGFVIFPYGEGLTQPTAYCSPLTHCDIELEPGEEILSVISGDQERWKFSPHHHGSPKGIIWHVMAKPTDFTSDMRTDITIGTNRRNYKVWLVSRLHGRTVLLQFYYPQDLALVFNGGEKKQKPAPVVDMAAILATQSQYTVEGDETLRPAIVGNDNTHTYFVMSPTLRNMDAPVVFELSPRGTRTLLNSRLVNNCYTIDKLVNDAILVWGVGADERIVTISRSQG